MRLGDGGWEEVAGKLETGTGPRILNLCDCWLDEQQVFLVFKVFVLFQVFSICCLDEQQVFLVFQVILLNMGDCWLDEQQLFLVL